MRRLVGVTVLLLGALLLVPVPLSNILPGLDLVLIACACLQRDGLLLCLGALGLMAARSALIGLVPALLLFLFMVRRERAFPLILAGVAAMIAAAVLLSPALLDRPSLSSDR